MSLTRHCKICNSGHKFKIKGLLSYPKHFVDESIQKYYQRIMKRFEEKFIQKVSLSEDHICYVVENDICEHCWLFMHQGFYCKKCQIYNHNTNSETKICTLCNVQFCKNCENPLDLFSQNKLCEFCQQKKDQEFGTFSFLLSFFISLLIPCFVFSFFLKKMLKTIEKLQYSASQYAFAIVTFLIAFPLIYLLSIIGFFTLLVTKIILWSFQFLQQLESSKMISNYICVYKKK